MRFRMQKTLLASLALANYGHATPTHHPPSQSTNTSLEARVDSGSSYGGAANPAPPAQDWTRDLQKVFDVDFTTDENGGCKSWEHQIKEAYSRANDMVFDTYERLGDLRQEAPKKSSKKADQELRRQYLRMIQPFRGIFGDARPAEQMLVSHAKDQYSTMLKMHKSYLADPEPNVYMRCKDDFLEYKPPSFQDPRSSSTDSLIARKTYTIGEPSSGNEAFPHGAWYAKDLPKDRNLFWWPNSKKDQKNSICDPIDSQLAFSMNFNGKGNLLVWCPAQLNRKDWSVDAAEQQIRPGNSIDQFAHAMAITWIHEMAHYGTDLNDVPVIDDKGTLGDAKGATRKDVFGWKQSALRGKYHQTLAYKSPENLALYAAAMWWRDFFWGTGTASLEPEKDEPNKLQKKPASKGESSKGGGKSG